MAAERRSLSYYSDEYCKDLAMLSIEYVHKRVHLFRIELSLMILAYLLVLMFLWQFLRILL